MKTLRCVDELEVVGAGSAASHVLGLIDDLDTDTERLAQAISGDAALAARIMSLANSAYYGVAGRVTNVQRAVSVVGFGHVRSVAALAALGVGHGGWDGFMLHAGFLAAAAGELAPLYGLRKPDAFSAGLLCDLGLHVFSTLDADLAAQLRRRRDLDAERAGFGMDHAELAGALLGRWNFPAQLTEAVAGHHHGGGALATTLMLADALRVQDTETLGRAGVTDAAERASAAWDAAAALSASML